jgi:hypothetical protein
MAEVWVGGWAGVLACVLVVPTATVLGKAWVEQWDVGSALSSEAASAFAWA